MAAKPDDFDKHAAPDDKSPVRPRSTWLERCDTWCRRLVLALAVTLGIAVVPVAMMMRTLPDVNQIREAGNTTKTTHLYDSSDRLLFAIEKEERTPVPLSEVSPHILHAVLATEDRRFYRHIGVDGLRMIAALVADVRAGGFVQGASTITQQLARSMFLDNDKSLWRKCREVMLAVRLERAFDKDKIFELYLNDVYFGHGHYGVEAASRGYFGKPASAVTLSEAALLAGLINAPSRNAPRQHPERARQRRALVLTRMVAAGYIDRETADAQANAAVVLVDARLETSFASYFRNYVVRELIERFGEEAVFQGGLHVYTTLDPQLQQAAELALSEGLQEIERRPRYRHPRRGTGNRQADGDATPYLQGAIVAMTPQGHIAALVGGRDFHDSAFDRATQAKRQPGSAFKPFIYAAALESGLTPATLITCLVSIDDAAFGVTPGMWWPDEAHGSVTEEMTVRTALRTSSNRAAAIVLSRIGLERALSYSRRFGFDPPPYPSMVLGTGEVSVLGLTTAYAAFANRGMVPSPIAIRRVEDRTGRVMAQDMPRATPAITDVTAFLTAGMLADVVNSGSGHAVRRAGFTLPAGGKTGTTDEFRDAWFAGFTPNLVASVWVGFDEPKTIAREGFGGDLAAPIWGRFMKLGQKPSAGGWIPQPPELIEAKVCALSGLLATAGCAVVEAYDANGHARSRSYVVNEYFRPWTEPTEFCPLHGWLDRVVHDVIPNPTLAEPVTLEQPRRAQPVLLQPPSLPVQVSPQPRLQIPPPTGDKPLSSAPELPVAAP